jgi:hypothetical protein
VNEDDLQRFEAELQHTVPARPPEDFMAQLRAARPGLKPAARKPVRSASFLDEWRGMLRLLAPALSLVVAGLFVARATLATHNNSATKPGLKADDVQVNHELVSYFDVVATLPGGQPVRFRCRKTQDQWVATDKVRGVEIEESRPSVEVIPVRFETY